MPKRQGECHHWSEGWPEARHSGKQRTGGPQEELPGPNGGCSGVQETGLCKRRMVTRTMAFMTHTAKCYPCSVVPKKVSDYHSHLTGEEMDSEGWKNVQKFTYTPGGWARTSPQVWWTLQSVEGQSKETIYGRASSADSKEKDFSDGGIHQLPEEATAGPQTGMGGPWQQ